MPPRERLTHGDFEIGGEGRHRVVRMLTPLDRLKALQQISQAQYEALRLLHLHWFLGCLAPQLRAVDLERTPGSGAGPIDALAHQEDYYRGMRRLTPIERSVATTLALSEFGLTSAGAMLGYQSPYRGRMAALKILQSAADRLIEAWRI
jgi:hypothetical protein